MRALLAAGAAALTVITFGAGGAVAKDGDVVNKGACSAGSDWKLKLSPENGQIETEFEVDSNVVGQSWNTKLKQNGVLVAQKVKVTKAPSGSFTFRRVLPDQAGSDLIVGKARNLSTAETCRGEATFPA